MKKEKEHFFSDFIRLNAPLNTLENFDSYNFFHSAYSFFVYLIDRI